MLWTNLCDLRIICLNLVLKLSRARVSFVLSIHLNLADLSQTHWPLSQILLRFNMGSASELDNYTVAHKGGTH